MQVSLTHGPWAQPRQRRTRSEPSAFARRVVATVTEWRRRIRERSQLAALDDRMLRDIGITRLDAQYLSNKPFWRE